MHQGQTTTSAMNKKPDWSIQTPVVVPTEVAEIIPNPNFVYRVQIIEPDKLDEIRSKFVDPNEWISNNFVFNTEKPNVD